MLHQKDLEATYTTTLSPQNGKIFFENNAAAISVLSMKTQNLEYGDVIHTRLRA